MDIKPLTTGHEWSWFKSRTHTILCEDMRGLVAYEKDLIVRACVADSFTVDGCNAHIAIDNPLVIRNGILSEFADKVFNEWGRKRIFGLVPDNNKKALDFDLHIGFKEVARVPDAVKEGVGYIVLRMDREDCRWLKNVREAA